MEFVCRDDRSRTSRYALLAAAGNLAQLLAARALTGFATGVASVVCNIYVAETSPPAGRGRLGAGFNVGITLGILLAYGLGAASAADGWWRTMAALGLVPALLFVLGAGVGSTASSGAIDKSRSGGWMSRRQLLPESPTYLRACGREREADVAQRALFSSGGGDERSPAAARGSDSADDGGGAAAKPVQPQPPGGFTELCAPEHRRAVVAGVGITLCFTMTGNNVRRYRLLGRATRRLRSFGHGRVHANCA